MNFTILRFDTLESTNTEAANQARQDADEGLCIVADAQTAGRGRQGRSWTSESGIGAYISLVLRPDIDLRFLSLIPLMTAVAIYDVLLKGFLIEADIKWPNDILVGEKKICGILTEAVDTPRGLAVIVGVGINLKMPASQANATSIEQESRVPVDRDEIVGVVIEDIAKQYEVLFKEPATVIAAWKQRSSYYCGKAVTVTLSNDIFNGTTDGLEENGALRVKRPDGSVTLVQAGDVERLRAA